MNNNDRKPLKTHRRAAARAFTLIELLIVIALTAVLLTLLIVPLISALRYTQQAQIVTAAQDAARITKERITRELGSAVFVFDGTSHPFQTSNSVTAGDDKYTNFLDLQILSSTGSPVVAHAYNAKLDFVLPRTSKGAVVDPTANSQEGVNYTQSQNGSAIISNPSYVFPLAAGTTMIRYFVGLKDPTKPYNNTREGKANGSDDNTYILYRAEFQPYIKNAAGTGVTPNPALFAARNNSSNVSIPELDDPDFFRYVSRADTDWLDDNHVTYGTTTLSGQDVASHNARVDKWVQISKPVIPGPNVDLLLLPHNADNTLTYDIATGAFPGTAHSGAAHDPVSGTPGKSYPIVNTSVTFRPATISGNATPGTTSDYNTQGVVSVDQAGYTYIPTVYTASSQSWSLPFHVGVFPGTYGQTGTDATATTALNMYYDTEQFAAVAATVTPPSGYPPSGVTNTALSINPGDILEYRHLDTDINTQGTLVYDVTQGFPVTQSGTIYTLGGTNFVPMTINPDSGTLAFTAPSLPNGPYDRLNRQWIYGSLPDTNVQTQADANAGGVDGNGDLDLTLSTSATPALTDSPLQGYHQLTTTSGNVSTGVQNAHLVPGSVRVTGPDLTPGPNQVGENQVIDLQPPLGSINPNGPQPVIYTEVNASVGTVGDNQFSVDYGTGTLHLSSRLSQLFSTLTLRQMSSLPTNFPAVRVTYDYQANMTLTTPLASPLPSTFTVPLDLSSNPYLPMQVKVDYQTRDLIDVNIGVRIYDITNNRAQVIPTETKIKIGNSNR